MPIALAYLIAHYWSLLIYQSQAVEYLISDPLGQGLRARREAGPARSRHIREWAVRESNPEPWA